MNKIDPDPEPFSLSQYSLQYNYYKHQSQNL